MKQLFFISILLVLVCCKKEDTEPTDKNVTYTAECDSCKVFYWVFNDGKSIAEDSIVKGNFSYSFITDVPSTLAISIKYENYSTDTFPVTARIKVNDKEVISETDYALNYGESDAGKDWVHTSYVLK